MVLNAYVASLELENSDEEESSEDELEDMDDVMEEEHETFVAPTMKEFSLANAKSFGKSLSITTSLRSLEEVVLRFCRPRIARKLIKGTWRCCCYCGCYCGCY